MSSSADCPLDDCSRIFPTYAPSVGGNVALLVLFAVLIPAALANGFRYGYGVFAAAVAAGLALEVMGYAGRILLSRGTQSRSSFAVFLLGTVMGPNFVSAAAFYALPRLVAVFGREFRPWRLVWYLRLLYGLTAASLLLEIAGGAVSTANVAPSMVDAGVRVLACGLALHLLALIIFAGHASFFAIAVRTRHHILDPTHAAVYNSGLFRAFILGFSVATLLLVLRTAFRVVVIAEGFESAVAQAEVLFLVFDGAAVFLASAILLALFPGRVFGNHRTSWRDPMGFPSSPPPISPRHYHHQNHPAFVAATTTANHTALLDATRKPARPPRPEPVQLLPAAAQKSPGLDRISPRSLPSENSPRRAYAPPPPPKKLVDNEELW